MIDIYSNQYEPHLVAYILLIVGQKIERVKEERSNLAIVTLLEAVGASME